VSKLIKKNNVLPSPQGCLLHSSLEYKSVSGLHWLASTVEFPTIQNTFLLFSPEPQGFEHCIIFNEFIN